MNIFLNLLNSLGIPTDRAEHVTITGSDPILPSPFLIGEAGAAVMAAIGYLAAELHYLKTKQVQDIHISVGDAAVAQRSQEYIHVLDGENQPLWSPISGFYQTKDDRWIQFHCNFPHHLQGVLTLLGCDNDKTAVMKAVKQWQADTLEDKLAELGMCAAIVRTADEWGRHPQAQAIDKLPLMEIIKIGESAPEPLPKGPRPLSGIHMLDLTRVIAGPVCGKTLAEHGATVMQITSPHLPSILPLVMEYGFGKLSAFLDFNEPQDTQKLIKLIKQTDIFSQSYRPGGLDEKGFSPEALMRLRPGIIYVSFSAYSHEGPWAKRHGYDSLVQSATGMVYEQSAGKDPKHLPAQSLDYLTGFLASLGAIEALRRRALYGGSYLVRVSLAQTAHWFTQLGRAKTDFSACVIPTREQIQSLLGRQLTAFGELEYILPVLHMSATPPHADRPPVPLGTDMPVWPE